MTFYRVLVRVVRVERNHLKITVPGWNPRSYFRVSKRLFPTFKWARDYRFYAYANLGAEKLSDLNISPPFEEGSTHVPSWKELVDAGAVTLTWDPEAVARIRKGKQ